MDRFKKGLQLFWFFFRIGWFTFGGGWSIVAQIQKEFVYKRKWMSDEELLDTVSVGRSLPGLMIGNVSFMFGYQNGGIFCAFMSLLGISTPALLIMIVVTAFYTQIKDNIFVARAMTGVRAAVVPIIGAAGMRLAGTAFRDKICYLIAALVFIMYILLGINAAVLVICGAAAGLLFDKEGKDADAH